MNEVKNDLIAYRLGNGCAMKLLAATSKREWMNDTNSGFANRCLPMHIADQAGWFILNDQTVRAKWSGGKKSDAIIIEYDGNPPHAAISHFGEGILSFSIPFIFRTPQGVALLFRGPANMPKDGVAPLEGIVETDWSVAGVSMNWKFTRENTWVEFARHEPICMIVPQRLELMESTYPHERDIMNNAQLLQNYQIWHESCRNFNERLKHREPEALRLGWQRYYYRGTAPHAKCEPIEEAGAHRTQLNLREFDEYIEATR
jgi:hypothetical protein